MFDRLSGAELLTYNGLLRGMPAAVVEARASELLEVRGLADAAGTLVVDYSHGMRKKIALAAALLHAPRVLFLDEPTVGLDPQTRTSIWEYINELKAREDITIFLTTHYMDEAEHCDRIAIIDHGKIVAIDTPEALKASVGKDRVQIHTADDAAAIAQLGRDFGIEAGIHEGAVTFSVAAGEEFVPRLFAGLSVPMLDFSASGVSSTAISPWSMIAIRSQCSASSM